MNAHREKKVATQPQFSICALFIISVFSLLLCYYLGSFHILTHQNDIPVQCGKFPWIRARKLLYYVHILNNLSLSPYECVCFVVFCQKRRYKNIDTVTSLNLKYLVGSVKCIQRRQVEIFTINKLTETLKCLHLCGEEKNSTVKMSTS